MRSVPTVFVLAVLVALAELTGCATEPTSAPAPAPVVAPAPAAAKLAVLNSGNGAAAVPGAEPVASTPPARKSSVPAGYKSVERDGTTLYCTRVATLGTKFKQEVCMTPDEYVQMQRRNEGMRQDLRKSTSMCSGGTGVSSCSGNSG